MPYSTAATCLHIDAQCGQLHVKRTSFGDGNNPVFSSQRRVMTRLCEEKTGLFPSPKDVLFTCSCPHWASMCKHVAAVLYGIGARLDHQPELLFTLRKVERQDLIAKAGSDLSKTRKTPAGSKVLASDDLSEMFGIEMAPRTSSTHTAASTPTTKARRKPAPRGS